MQMHSVGAPDSSNCSMDPPADDLPAPPPVTSEFFFDCSESFYEPYCPTQVRARGIAARPYIPPPTPFTWWFWIGVGFLLRSLILAAFGF